MDSIINARRSKTNPEVTSVGYANYPGTSHELLEEGRPKWAPEVKWATPITANMVKAMAKIMMPVSSPSREGTMEFVACELQHKNKQ